MTELDITEETIQSITKIEIEKEFAKFDANRISLVDKKIAKLEENFACFRDLQVLTLSGAKIMDAITNYVIS